MQKDERGKPVPITPQGTLGVHISPDSKTLAAISSDYKLYLYPVAGGVPKFLASVDEVEEVDGWSNDGRYLFLTKYGLPAEVDRMDAETGKRKRLYSAAPADPAGVAVVGPVLVTPNGNFFVYAYTRVLSTLYAVRGLESH